jgi:HSP20 family protein
MKNDPVHTPTHQSWQWLVNGWHNLRDKAMNALTYFSSDQDVGQSSSQRWAVVAADLVENNDNILVELELPGMEKADLTVDVIDKRLLVSGEKRSHDTRREGTLIITERAFGSFQRVVPLPCAVDRDKVRAEYKKGVLKIVLPKDPRAQAHTIPIRRS